MAKSRLRVALGATIAALGLLAAACGGSNSASGGTPQQGGTATWAELAGATPNWIFPFVDSAHNSVNSLPQFQYLMYRPLYWFGNGNQPTLNEGLSLANTPVYSNNNSTITISLKNYKWSNGETVNSTDVMFWMNMMFAEKANYAGYVPTEFPDNVKKAEATGPEQVTLTLNGSYAPEWYTNNQLGLITPMPEAWDKTTDAGAAGSGGCATDQSKCAAVYNYLYNKSKNLKTYATDPVWQVVDGPWHLTSFDTDGNVTMVPNKTYSGPTKPKLSEFKEVPFTSDTAEYNVLRSGNTINFGYMPSQDLPERQVSSSNPLPPSNPLGSKYVFTPAYVWGWSYLPINYGNPTFGPAFKQLYVRQALQETLDQKTQGQVAFRGYATPTTGPVPTVPATQYVGSVQKGDGPYPFNVNKAKSLLTSHGWTIQNGTAVCTSPGTASNQCGAGVPAGQKLNPTLEYASGSNAVNQIVDQWKSDASKAGIDITLNQKPFNTVISDTTACPTDKSTCNWQMTLFGYETYSSGYPTGDAFFLPGSAINYSGVDDSQLTSLVNATLHSSSGSAFQQYANYTAQQLPGALNYSDSYGVDAISSNLKGAAPTNPLGSINPENWYFTK
jgi:peptide/nickel transport system substrate-binding protein